MKMIRELSDTAILAASVVNCELDYSSDSISRLDELVHDIHLSHRRNPKSEDSLTMLAYTCGAYLGETLLRNGLKALGFAWMKNEEGEYVIGNGEDWMAPVTKVYKRMTEGPYHDLTAFYDVCLGLAKGTIDRTDPRLHIMEEQLVQ